MTVECSSCGWTGLEPAALGDNEPTCPNCGEFTLLEVEEANEGLDGDPSEYGDT